MRFIDTYNITFVMYSIYATLCYIYMLYYIYDRVLKTLLFICGNKPTDERTYINKKIEIDFELI